MVSVAGPIAVHPGCFRGDQRSDQGEAIFRGTLSNTTVSLGLPLANVKSRAVNAFLSCIPSVLREAEIRQLDQSSSTLPAAEKGFPLGSVNQIIPAPA